MKRLLRAAFRLALVITLPLVIWLLAVWPPPVWYRTHWPAETAFMWMRGGEGAGGQAREAGRRKGGQAGRNRKTASSDEPRVRLYDPVPIDSISPFLGTAVQIGEDNAFPTHGGIDWRSLRQALGYPRDRFEWTESRDREALWMVVPQAWERRSALRGASTITQQLAKNLYLSPSRNPLRKVKEAVTAYRLEWGLGKERILELYLNVVELGDGVWGVEAASQLYFHRPARSLSLDQAAALAGTLPFPLRSNPGYRPGRMRWRQNLILRRMQGEAVEVPPDVSEESPVVPAPPDSEAPQPAPAESVPADTAPTTVDSIAPPVDSFE